jgi:hypothetical protein
MSKFTLNVELKENDKYCNECPCFMDDKYDCEHRYCAVDNLISLKRESLNFYVRPDDCPLKLLKNCTTCKHQKTYFMCDDCKHISIESDYWEAKVNAND